jgi:hypothetical protein
MQEFNGFANQTLREDLLWLLVVPSTDIIGETPEIANFLSYVSIVRLMNLGFEVVA